MLRHASAAGGQPKLLLSACYIDKNNGLEFPNPTYAGDSHLETEAEYAIHTPWFPEYRIGLDNGGGDFLPMTSDLANAGSTADINSDGAVDGADVDALFAMLGMCRNDLDESGQIDFNDLLNVLVDFGNTCE